MPENFFYKAIYLVYGDLKGNLDIAAVKGLLKIGIRQIYHPTLDYEIRKTCGQA